MFFFKAIIAKVQKHLCSKTGWKTVGNIPREISHYVYFFIKEENGKVFGTLKVLLSLTFSCKEKWVIDTVEEFIENFNSFEYSGNLHC